MAPFAFDLTAGHVEVFRGELCRDLAEWKIQRLEPPRVQIDLDFAHFAAVDFDRRNAVNLLERRLEIILNLSPGHIRGLR